MLTKWKPGAVAQSWCSWKHLGLVLAQYYKLRQCSRCGFLCQCKIDQTVFTSMVSNTMCHIINGQPRTWQHKSYSKYFFFFFELGLYSFPPSQSAFKMIQSVLYVLINLSMWVYVCVKFSKHIKYNTKINVAITRCLLRRHWSNSLDKV